MKISAFAVVVVACLAALPLPLGAAEKMPASKPETKKAIVAVIEAQLAAFRKSDAEKAYSYAAADLRAQKPLRVFTAIVKENYPEIWANTRAEFGIVRDDDQHAAVTVQVYSKSNDAAYDFTLVKEKAGWRINGVLRHEPKSGGKV
jgi:hypothetical protein